MKFKIFTHVELLIQSKKSNPKKQTFWLVEQVKRMVVDEALQFTILGV
jgi:hypothetical protein